MATVNISWAEYSDIVTSTRPSAGVFRFEKAAAGNVVVGGDILADVVPGKTYNITLTARQVAGTFKAFLVQGNTYISSTYASTVMSPGPPKSFTGSFATYSFRLTVPVGHDPKVQIALSPNPAGSMDIGDAVELLDEVDISEYATVSAGADQTVGAGSVVTLIGTPAGGTWSQDSGSAVVLSAPVSNGTDTRVTFTATNASTTVNDTRVFRYTVSEDPTETDTFDRPASTVTLGTHPNGREWTSDQGTWGITADGQAYSVTGNNDDRTFVNTSSNLFDISAKVTLAPNGWWDLVGAYTAHWSNLALDVQENGSMTLVNYATSEYPLSTTGPGVIKTGDVVRFVRDTPTNARIFINGTEYGNGYPITGSLPGTYVGMRLGASAPNPGVRWDDFTVKQVG